MDKIYYCSQCGKKIDYPGYGIETHVNGAVFYIIKCTVCNTQHLFRWVCNGWQCHATMKNTGWEYTTDQTDQKWKQALLPLLDTLDRLEAYTSIEAVNASEDIRCVLVEIGILPEEE